MLVDALSRIYSDEAKRMVWAESEYVPKDVSEGKEAGLRRPVAQSIIAGLAAAVSAESGLNSEGVRRNPVRTRITPTRYDLEIPGVVVSKPAAKRGSKGKQRASMSEAVSQPDTEDWAGVLSDEALGQERPVDPDNLSDPLNITGLVSEIDVIAAIRNGYADNSHLGRIVKNVNEYTGYIFKDGLLYTNEHGRTYLCVPDAEV
ncbi:hypothetical protein FRC10_004493, partial [Ceratobasidium sp. 414]